MSKAKDKANKPVKKPSVLILSIMAAGMALIMALIIVLNVITMVKFDNILTQFVGYGEATLKGDTLGADTQYVKSDFHCASDLYSYEEKLCAEIAQDGATLLDNKGLLPLAEGTQLDLYSCSSVNFVSGGSGSGSGSFELTADLKEGLEHSGFKINQTLWNFYKSGGGSKYSRGAGVINYGRGFEWEINECPLSVITSDKGVMNSIDRHNVAVFVISRTGGEGGDEPRDMYEFGGKRGEHYLQLNAEEKEVIEFIGNNYDSVIILVNCNNAFELGFLRDTAKYKNIKAVVNFPGAGRTGTYGLGYFLRGKDADGKEISPSGHLVDTFVYDNFSSPAMQNFGDAAFTDENGNVIMYWGGDNYTLSNGQYGGSANEINEDAGRCPFYFVTYNEGVYIGYRYYETRYEDYVLGTANLGNYNYSSTVTYPFGFGSSYTSFEWQNFSVTEPDSDGNMTVTVDVKNVGARNGRDVVQIYYQSPYTEYDKTNHVEKPAVSLVGFYKTGNIKPGKTESVDVTVNIDDFKSYCDVGGNGSGGYYLEKGDYYVTAAHDAHTAINNILKSKCAGNATALAKICETADVTNEPCQQSSASFAYKYTVGDAEAKEYSGVTNLFSDATLIDRSEYLSRSNWAAMDNNGLRYATSQVTVNCPGVGKNPWGNTHIAACAEVDGKQFRAVASAALREKLMSNSSLIPAEKQEANTEQTVGAKNGLDLIDLRGASYDDPRWEELLDQLTIEELSKMVAQCGYCSPEMKSVNKPLVYDLDGPAGLNKVVGHGSWPIGDGLVAMTWVSEYMLACTWDTELALKMGDAIGEDGLHGSVVGWYGPGLNIHRTPFGGRNFEYYSEDPYLSGMMGKNEVKGASGKGLYGFVKHFALNDQETHRDQNGLATFANEQSMREIYFKPFEMTIKNNNVTVNYNQPVKDESGNTVSYVMKSSEIPATTSIMSSFNRIGATWAGGNYNLITKVLREEFGFKGFVLTDYDTGNYMISNTKQMLEAGGDAKLNTIGEWSGLKSGDDKNQNIAYAKNAAKNVLYTVANSAAMNGYVHGVQYVAGFAYYKLVIGAIDILLIAGLGVLCWRFIVKLLLFIKFKKGEIPEDESGAAADGNAADANTADGITADGAAAE